MNRYLKLALVLLALCGFFVAYETWIVRSFFPPDSFGEKWSRHYYRAKWYSNHLRAMDEEPLPRVANDDSAAVYRFTCLRTFHRPFSISITKNYDVFKLERKVLSGMSGFDAKAIEDSASFDIPAEKVAELDELLKVTKFSDMPSSVATAGLDGSQWIFEVVSEGKYQLVDRWSPREDTSLRKIGMWFLDTAEWTPREIY